VLVGDAGYCPTPLTGLGTSLALVGGYVLAGEIARGDHPRAFARYEEVMRPYVGRGQQLPPGGVAGYAPGSNTMIRLRAMSMRAMTRWPLKNVLAGQFSKADEIELPEYDLAPCRAG
jgi:2-polyprenyl-6-methoxyphenol hydroxylase-like FAD-dependent oxidoreductase